MSMTMWMSVLHLPPRVSGGQSTTWNADVVNMARWLPNAIGLR